MKIGDMVRVKDSDLRVRIIGMMPLTSAYAKHWTASLITTNGYVVLTECPCCHQDKEYPDHWLTVVTDELIEKGAIL